MGFSPTIELYIYIYINSFMWFENIIVFWAEAQMVMHEESYIEHHE